MDDLIRNLNHNLRWVRKFLFLIYSPISLAYCPLEYTINIAFDYYDGMFFLLVIANLLSTCMIECSVHLNQLGIWVSESATEMTFTEKRLRPNHPCYEQ